MKRYRFFSNKLDELENVLFEIMRLQNTRHPKRTNMWDEFYAFDVFHGMIDLLSDNKGFITIEFCRELLKKMERLNLVQEYSDGKEDRFLKLKYGYKEKVLRKVPTNEPAADPPDPIRHSENLNKPVIPQNEVKVIDVSFERK